MREKGEREKSFRFQFSTTTCDKSYCNNRLYCNCNCNNMLQTHMRFNQLIALKNQKIKKK